MTDKKLSGEGQFKPGAKDWKENVYTGPGAPSEEAQRDARYRSKFSWWDDLKFTIGFPLAFVVTLAGVAALLWVGVVFIRGGLKALGG